MAVTTPIRRVILTANESKKRISQGAEGIKNIREVILKRTKVKREAFARTNLFRKRREENEKRMMLEDEIEAPRKVTMISKGPQELIEKTGAGGFFNRILGFIGYLAAGWLMNNLPTWIAMGKEFIARIRKAGEILSGFFDNTIKLFTGVGNLLKSLAQNLVEFDFFDTSDRVKNSMNELNNTMGNLTGQIEEAFSLLTTPLTEGKYSGEEIPEVGTQYEDKGAYVKPPPSKPDGAPPPSPSSTAISSGGGNLKPLLDMISSGESPGGGYTAMFPSESHPQILGMTINQVIAFQKEKLKDGRRSAAIGRYQMLYPENYAKAAGLPLTAKFSPANQDKMVIAYLKKYRKLDLWLQGKISDAAFSEELAREFGTFKSASGFVLPNNTGSIGFEQMKPVFNKIKNSKSKPSTPRQKPQTKKPPGSQGKFVPLTGTSGKSMGDKPLSTPTSPFLSKAGPITSGFGYRWGKVHKGYDVGVPIGTPVSAYFPGVVTRIGYDKNGYGHYIEWKDSVHNQIHFFAHLKQRPSISVGKSFEAGKLLGYSGNTGKSTAPHLHWEIGPQGSEVDPGKWLRSVGAKRTPVSYKSEAVQMSVPTKQTATLPFTLTPERKGQDVIIVDQPKQQENLIASAANDGGPTSSPISDFDLLNNFIKNKLLLDLAYL